MPLPRDQKIIVTSADGTRRRRLPAAQIMDATARIERYGGYGQFTVNTAIPYKADALSSVVKGDRVEFYYKGIRRYRGYIEERLQTEGEPDTLSFTGFGMSFLAGQQFCYGRYAYAGVGVDIADAFAEIVRDATVSRNQVLPPASGRLGLPVYQALQVLKIGTTTTFVDAYHKILKDVANDLVQNQAGNLAIWGGDVDAFDHDRLFIRPLTPTTFPATHTILIPSRQTEAAQAEDQAGDVKNRVLYTGGSPRFPQLVHNGGFDLPVVFQQGDSGLITDGDFENQSWSLGSGASYKDAGHNEGQPFSGNWMVELDHPGESADKSGSFAAAPVAGDSYVFSVRAKKEVGLQVADGSGWLHVQGSGGNVLLAVPLVVAPAGTAWDYFSSTFAMPAGAAKWAAHFQADHVQSYGGDSGGLLIDAVALENASVIYQDGYQTAVYGNAEFLAVNWVYKDTCYDGLYCVYVNVSAQDVDLQDAHLEPLNRARFNISVKQTLRASFRYRSPVQMTAGLSLPKMRLHLDWYRQDGSYIGNSGGDMAAQPVSTTWQYFELVAAPPGDAASCCPTVIFRTSGEVLIDAVSAQDAEATLAGDVPVDPDGHPGFLPEGALSTFMTAGSSGLGGAWAASESVYGSRVDIVSEGSVDTLSGLSSVAKGRLRNTALPLTRPGITRIADPNVYWPGDSVSLQGRHGPALAGGQDNPGGVILSVAAVALTLGDLFKAKLEVDKEQPSTDLIVKQLVQDQLAANGPGGGNSGGTGGGYSNPTNGGGGTTGVQAVSSVNAQTGIVVLTAAEVGAEPALGNPAVSGYVLASTTGGVRSWVSAPAGGGGGTTAVVGTPSPYWRMQSKFNAVSRIPAPGDFSGVESLTYFANGPDGSLRYETPGLTLAAYWRMGLSNTTAADITVRWSLPYVDNFAAGDFSGTSLFSVPSSGPGGSGTFTVHAGTSGTLSLYYANTASQVYDTSNQGTFWFQMDGLLQSGLVFLDADTGQSPTTVIIGDATTAAPGLVEVHANAAGGQHPVVYLDTEVDALIQAEAAARQNADTAEAAARTSGDALALQKSANLSDVQSPSMTRTNLGLGTAASLNVPSSGNAASNQIVLGSDTRLAAAGSALQKRRLALTMYPASGAADTAPNTTQVARLPKGTGGAASQWKLMSATLRVETPNANATTAQLYYTSAPANAAFGAGTAALSNALSATGTSTYEVSTSSFTGTLAATGLPSGSLLAPQFSALGGGSNVSLETEWEEA